MTEQQLQDKFLGKRIKLPWINNTGYGIVQDNDSITGICGFIGYNKHMPNWGLQVTIDRTAITHVDYTKIQII